MIMPAADMQLVPQDNLVALFEIPLSSIPEFKSSLDDADQFQVIRLFELMKEIHDAKNKRAMAEELAANYQGVRGMSAPNLLKKYYEYVEKFNWRILANKAKAPKLRTNPESKRLISEEFWIYWRGMMDKNKRVAKAAYREMVRDWSRGKSIPGFGTWQQHFEREFEQAAPAVFPDLPFPVSERHCYRKGLTKAQRDLSRQGIGKARERLPGVKGTRHGLRFLEVIEFDDLKLDFKIGDPESKKPVDLWMLRAQDKATGLILGYVLRPAITREDGKQDHLKQSDMRQLLGFILETYGLPPYPVTWRFERGTATIPQDLAVAIEHASGGMIKVSYTSMIAGRVPGKSFNDAARGNPQGKGSLESINSLLLNETGDAPGQTGPIYTRRPAELAAIEAEAKELLKLQVELDPDLAEQVKHKLFMREDARRYLNLKIHAMNNRHIHNLEGFGMMMVWRNSEAEPWRPLRELPEGQEPVMVHQVKESPMDRMLRLVCGYDFKQIHPSFLLHFYNDSLRQVWVNEREIKFRRNGKDYVFRPVTAKDCPPERSKFIAYFNPEDPRFLHLNYFKAGGGGAYYGTWLSKESVRWGDHEALEAALKYTRAAFDAEAQPMAELNLEDQAAEKARQEFNRQLVEQQKCRDADRRTGVDVETVAVVPSQLSEGNHRGFASRVARNLSRLHQVTQQIAEGQRSIEQAGKQANVSEFLNEPTSAGSPQQNQKDSSLSHDEFLNF